MLGVVEGVSVLGEWVAISYEESSKFKHVVSEEGFCGSRCGVFVSVQHVGHVLFKGACTVKLAGAWVVVHANGVLVV